VNDVALATCSDFPAGDEDAAALNAALAAAGVDSRWQVWNDPDVDWTRSLVVLRSTWDYTLHHDGFLAWTRSVPRLVNAADVVEWNSDKVYLRDLAAAGVAIVPTEFAAPGDAVPIPASGEFVVKPSVGAGSRGTGRFDASTSGAAEDAAAHAAALHEAGRTVLVQPFLADVETLGETALIYLDGEFSHAVNKASLLPVSAVHGLHDDALYVEEMMTPHEVTQAELAAGAQVIDVLADRFGAHQLYTRVDLLPTPDGPRLVELEVTEPSLFLSFDDGAADRFAAAIARRV